MSFKLAISQRVVSNDDYCEVRDALSHDSQKFIFENFSNEFILIPIPNNTDIVQTTLQETDIDGLILSGGNDIGESKERDMAETLMLDHALNNNIPILGVCRGLQMINKYFGGTVSFDIKSALETTHVAVEHGVDFINESPIGCTSPSMMVNSFHNDGIFIENLSKFLKPFAICNRNLVEGVQNVDKRLIAVQWHPERKQSGSAAKFDVKLFEKLFCES